MRALVNEERREQEQAVVRRQAEQASATRDECFVILEIPRSAEVSADLVRRQYNLLSERYAPSKVEAMGPEFVKMAEAKFAAVRRSASTLLEAIGERLDAALPISPPQDLRHNPDLDSVFGGM
jgi:hypothetical protein